MTKKLAAFSLSVLSGAFMLSTTMWSNSSDNFSASIVTDKAETTSYTSLLDMKGAQNTQPNSLNYSNGNQYRKATNEMELIEQYGSLIEIDDLDTMSDEDIETMLFIASRYDLNPVLKDEAFTVLPVHDKTTTTDGNWAALMNPYFPSTHMRQERPGYFLTADEVAKDVAALFTTSNRKASEALYYMGAIKKSEMPKWENSTRVGLSLVEAAGLLRSAMKSSEKKGLQVQANESSKNDRVLDEEPLKVSKATIELVALSILEDRKNSVGGPNSITPRMIASMIKHLENEFGQVMTSQHVLELREIFLGSRNDAPYMIPQKTDLGDCNNQLNSKMSFDSHMITGAFRSTLSCRLEINDTEQVEISISIPSYSSLLNFTGLPLIEKYKNTKDPRRPAFEASFPMNLRNTVVLGPEGEAELEIQFKMKRRKEKDQLFGLGLINPETSELISAQVKEYQEGRNVQMNFTARHYDGNRIMFSLDESIPSQQ